jgi:predicted  nucleic acid-binding Zn-ribbon protein
MPRVAKPPVPQTPAAENKGSAIHDLLGEVNQAKENLKNVLGALTSIAGKLKAVEKEKRMTEKEVEAIRKQLRRIQTVTI